MWIKKKFANLFEWMKSPFLDITIAKILWFLTYTLSFSGFVFYTREAYIKFDVQPDITINIRLRPSHEFPSPALTICAPKIVKSELVNFTDAYFKTSVQGEVVNFTVEEQNYLRIVYELCGVLLTETNLIINRTEKDVYKLLVEGYPDIQTTCSYHNHETDCEKMLSPVITEYGICHTFNMEGYQTIFNPNTLSENFDWFKRDKIAKILNPEMKEFNESVDDTNPQVNWKLERGYLVHGRDTRPVRAFPNDFAYFVFAINQIDVYDLCYERNERFLLAIHLPNEIPNLNHETVFFELGKQTEVMVETKSYKTNENLRKFGSKSRECYFDGEKELKFFKAYTKANCDFECWANLTLKECGCVQFGMPRVNETPVCDLDQVTCYINAKVSWSMYMNESVISNVPCDCFPPCNNIQYNLRSKEENELRHDLLENLIKKYKNDTVMTTLYVKTQDYFIEERESFVAYTLQNFVADCGGLLGLFMGWSVITFAEFIQNMFRAL